MAQEYGIPLSEIPEKQFCTVDGKYTAAIRKSLESGGIAYHAKVSDNKTMLAFSKNDKDRVLQILEKCENLMQNSDFLEQTERFQKESTPESAKALLPEIASVLHVSVASLERKPPDLQLWLVMTYTANCFSDDLTLKKALQQELMLNHESETEVQVLIEEKKTEMPEQAKLNENLHLEQERQQETEKQKEIYTSREVLKQNAQRIREETTPEHRHREVIERERIEEQERVRKEY